MQLGRISSNLANSEGSLSVMSLGQLDLRCGPVYTRDLGAPGSKDAGEPTLPAPDVEDIPPSNRARHSGQPGAVQPVAMVVVPFLDEPVPIRRDRIPSRFGESCCLRDGDPTTRDGHYLG